MLKKPLTVIAADVIRQDIEIFSTERTPRMVVADAVRMSMSIPFFFRPVPFGGGLMVDGGVLSNFPAWVFGETQEARPLPILGFRLLPEDVPPPEIRNMCDLAKSLATTVVRASTQLQISHLRELHTIEIPTLEVRATDFGISEEQKNALYQSGYEAATEYLENTPL
jgi:NTE family protein